MHKKWKEMAPRVRVNMQRCWSTEKDRKLSFELFNPECEKKLEDEK